jgi:energy-coupling factor transporter ATP-binding protein EcfA2
MQLTDKYRPRTFAAFAGMERPKRILTAFAEHPYAAAFLLIGPSGTGKTTMALALAEAIHAEIHHIPSRACDLETVQGLLGKCHYVPMFGDSGWHMPLIDEADQISRAAQHAFLSALDTTAFPPQTVFVFTANETSNLEERFLSRCRKIQFSTEGLLAPGAALLARIWRAETRRPRPAVPDFAVLLRTAGFNREALMLLETEILCPGSVIETASARGSLSAKHSTPQQARSSGAIYTIGAEGYTVGALRETMKALGCGGLLDCCLRPQRAYRAGLGSAYLEWAGDRLGPGRVAQIQREEGIKRLLGLITSGESVMLLYDRELPGECVRHHVLGQTLYAKGIEVQHVFGDELIPYHELQKCIETDGKYSYKSTRWCLPKVVGE